MSYTDTFIANVTIAQQNSDGWLEVKDAKGNTYTLTAFGSKAVKKGKRKYALYVREAEHFTFYHLR